jgi:D-arabinose 1-dehydrogenase-like Zn-dependent alcohol dehydrogenase
MIAPYESIARIPEGVSMNTGGPLMCAGMTVYNALRNSGARPGNVVAIQVCVVISIIYRHYLLLYINESK